MVNAINVKKDIGVNNVKIIVVLIAKIIFVIKKMVNAPMDVWKDMLVKNVVTFVKIVKITHVMKMELVNKKNVFKVFGVLLAKKHA